MNNKTIAYLKFILPLICLVMIAGCGGGNDIKSTLGLRRQAPDEFVVISNPPLRVPPEFKLTPPSSDSEFDKLSITNDFSEQLPSDNKELSTSDQNFLTQLDHHDSNSKVKKLIDKENAERANKHESVNRVKKVLNQVRGQDDEPVIDPIAERKRIDKNIINNLPVDAGKVQEKKRSTIDRIFN